MKKLLSIILAFVMAFSVSVVAFAADETITAGKEKTITATSSDWRTLTFTAPKSGVYKINCSISGQGYADVVVVNKKSNESCTWLSLFYYSSQDASNSKAESAFITKSGEKYEVRVSAAKDEDAAKAPNIKILVSEYAAPKLVLGKTKVAVNDKTQFYVFKADKKGNYNFRSDANKAIDPTIEIIGTSGYITYNDDNGYGDNCNFDLTQPLNAGESCLLFINTYTDSTKYKDFNVTVTLNKKIPVEKIESGYEEYGVELLIGEEIEDNFFCVPTGALVTAGIKIESSKPKTVSVNYKEGTNEFSVKANRLGKATVTITAENGVSTSFKVSVHSQVFYFLRNIIWRIKDFFYNLFTGGFFY